jgi:SAM-dependent methyltransferase
MLASAAMPAWYERAFGPWYLKLYAHRDREEASRTLETLRPWLAGEGPVLDVACGAGRHLELLAGPDGAAFGLDRSRTLLAAAPGGIRDRLVHGDMRKLPFPDATFRAVLCLFTSFGYFETDEDHRDLLREFARVSRSGGRLVLDLANPPALRRGLVTESTRHVEGHTVCERRSLVPRDGGERVVKEVLIRDDSGLEVASFREEVALYDRDRLAELLEAAAWREVVLFGDYAGCLWTPEAPRLLVVAAREDR